MIDFDLRENMELAKELKIHAKSNECPEHISKLMDKASARLIRTTKHLEFWISKISKKSEAK